MTDLALAVVPVDVGEVVLGKLKCDGEQDMKRVKNVLVQRLQDTIELCCICWALGRVQLT